MSAVFVIAGSVIGAGLATGKEIYVFFYGGNPAVVAVLCFLLFSGAFVLVTVAAKKFGLTSSDGMFGLLYGKAKFAADFLLNLCYFLVLSTMIATANLCLSELAGMDEKIGVFAVLTAVVTGAALSKGMKGVKIINAVAVPLVVAFIAAMCIGGEGVVAGEAKIFSAGGYACFNTVMMIGILLSLAKNMSVKENVAASLISALMFGALIWLILSRLNHPVYQYIPMPLISLAKSVGKWLYVAGSLVLYLSILTTALSVGFPLINRLEGFFKSKTACIVGVVGAAAVFSFAGFDAIIAWSYPFISLLGAAILLSLAARLLFEGKGKGLLRVLRKRSGEGAPVKGRGMQSLEKKLHG